MFTRLTERYFVSHHPLAVFWVQHGEALPDSWGVPVIITGSCAGLRICYIHNNEQTKCLCSQPKDKKKCLDSSLLFLCLCTSASNTRRSSIGFSHISYSHIITFGALLQLPSCANNCALIAVLVPILQMTVSAIHLTSSSSIHISALLASAHSY